MKKLITFIIVILIAFIGVFIFYKKTNNEEDNKNLVLENYSVSHDTKFGGIYINISIDDFNKIGFKYGDSVDLKFSNGYELKDIPYYNGYYVEIGELELVGYPGYPYIKVCRNYGDDLWIEGNIDENITATLDLQDLKSLKNLYELYNKEKEKNKELENKLNSFKYLGMVEMIDKYFIDKDKIREKIEELENYIQENSDEQGYWGRENQEEIYEKINILQELLEGRN